MTDDRPSQPRKTRRAAEFLKSMLRYAALVAVLLFARSTLADQYNVPTGSMWPTIEPGDRIFVEKFAYGFRVPFGDGYLIDEGGPTVGDIVVVADPRGGPIPLVKRVVAVAGQTVEERDGIVYLDGQEQRVEKLADGRVVEHLGSVTHLLGERDFDDFGPIVVPADHVFAMGDNRANSADSRVLGPIPRGLVRGRVVSTLYKYDGAGFDSSRLFHKIE